MPHKHKRKRGDDEADFNLPPTQKARSLPVSLKSSKSAKTVKNGKPPAAAVQDGPKSKGKKGRGKENDVPRAFRRLMSVAQGRKVRSGLDDGSDGKTAAKEAIAQDLKIRPGEDMRSFAFRVNASLPISGLAKKTVIKDGKDEAGFKVLRTRKERKMHKLYDQWRTEDEKIKDQREEESEQAAEREADGDEAGMAAVALAELNEATSKRKKKSGRGQAEEDPWLELKKKRAEAKVGLHDTAKAPPELNKNVKRLKITGGAAVDVANVPKASGSLRRREELQTVRADVVDAYRKIREHEQAKLNARS